MSTDPESSIGSPTGSDSIGPTDRAAAEALLDVWKKLDVLQTEQAGGVGAGESSSEAATITPQEKALMLQMLDALGQMDLREAVGEVGTEGEQGGGPRAAGVGVLPGLQVPAEIAGVEENGDQDMGLFDKYRICICSEVEGIITKDGQPLAGAEVVRRLDLFLPKDRVYTETTTTDVNGAFSFPPAYARKWKPLLGEVRTDQRILVHHEGRTYLGWWNVSSGRELHEDIRETYSPRGEFYFRLNFRGDLARATPLLDQSDEGYRISKELCFFNTQTVCVASSLHFTVTRDGVAAAGARVVRTAEFVGVGGFEQCKETDRDGEVELAAIYTPRLVHRDAKIEIQQRIVIHYEGKEYLGWERTKTNPWYRGEFNRDEDKWGYEVEIDAELSEDDTLVRGVKTDPQRRWSDDLPDDFIQYRGFLKITRYK